MATSHFTGILHFAMNGMAKQSYLRQTDGVGNTSDALLIRELPPGSTLAQQISAATAYFANKYEGDGIAVDGNLVPFGTNFAIEF